MERRAGKIGAKVGVEVKGQREREEDLRCKRKRKGAKKGSAGGKEGERGGRSKAGQGKGERARVRGQDGEEVKQNRATRFRAKRSTEVKNGGGGARGV
jgi:hypothetical protein